VKISADVLRSIQRREKRKLRKRRGAMSVRERKDSAEAVSEVVVWGGFGFGRHPRAKWRGRV
jgi:hypothetical protein